MKFINLKSSLPKDKLYSVLTDCNFVNERVLFDEKRGKPLMKFKKRKNTVHVSCEMIGGNTKDNGFFIGTFFLGSLKEKNGVTTLKGMILTAPLYHLFIIGMMAFYIYRCISLNGFNPVPPILFIFSMLMFKNEFKKQGIMERYFKRAFRKAEMSEGK
jgi:hypothetical protein